MIEKFIPSLEQLIRLDSYDDFLVITEEGLEEVEADSSVDIGDVPDESKQDVLALIQADTASAIEPVAEELIDGGTLESFERKTAEAVTSGLLLALVLALGGTRGMRQKPALQEFILGTRSLISGQLRATQRTADRIADGQLTPQQIRKSANRRALGVRSGFSSASIMNRMVEGFHNEGKRFLTSPHPCPDCPVHQRPDWTPLSDIVPVATFCVCQSNCKCRVVTRFNPRRALGDLLSGNLLDSLSRRREVMAREEQAYLARHGWLQ